VKIDMRVMTVAVLWAGLLLSGCAGPVGPRAWEKGHLAHEAMRPDLDPLGGRLATHWYFSREAASGGVGVSGGGCGCN
jgi:Domain of unknown function (DUF4266)